MKNDIKLAVPDFLSPINFPDFCLYCDEPSESHKNHIFKFKGKVSNELDEHNVEFHLPYCKKHAKIYMRNKILDTIFLVLSTVIGLLAIFFLLSGDFLPDWLYDVAPGYTVVGGRALRGLIIYFPIKLLSTLVLKLVSGYPGDNPLGIYIYYYHEAGTMQFEIDNDDFARRFEAYGDKFSPRNQISAPAGSNESEVDQVIPGKIEAVLTDIPMEIPDTSETTKEDSSLCSKCHQEIETYEFTCPSCGHTQWELIGCGGVFSLIPAGFVVYRVIIGNTTGILFWVCAIVGALLVAVTIQSIIKAIQLKR